MKSIESLETFSNLYEVVICGNPNLISLVGLENHTTMSYLISQYSGITTLSGLKGCGGLTNIIINNNQLKDLNELSSTNLSLLYCKDNKLVDISSVKNCTNLTYVNFEKNTDSEGNTNSLNDISSLQYCLKIVKCYLEDNTNLDVGFLATEEFKTLLKRCGSNYSLNKKYALVYTEGAKQDFFNFGLTDSQLILLNGNENIRGIRLGGNPGLSNSVINEVLGSMPNLESVDLEGCNQVTTIDFIRRLNKLATLNLYGTNVTDLSYLEDLAKDPKYQNNPSSFPLKMLAIDNDNIDVTSIQNLISMVSYAGASNIYEPEDNSVIFGICIRGEQFCEKFKDCRNITRFRTYAAVQTSTWYGDVDLSNCNGLKTCMLRSCGYRVILPRECEEVNLDGMDCSVSMDNCQNLKSVATAWWWGDMQSDILLEKLIPAKGLSYLNCIYSNFGGQITKLGDLTTTETLNIFLDNTGTTDFLISKDTDLKIGTFSLNNCGNFYTLDGFEHIKSINELYIENDKVSALKPLTNITPLNVLSANNNKISSLEGVQNLVNLTTLNVGGNSISDLYWLGRLADNDQIKLTSLDLSDNSIENNITASIDTNGDGNKESVYVDNLSIIEKLYNKGCKNINLKNNENLDISRLSRLAGVQY